MTPVTAADLDRWEALAAAATPGPWERDVDCEFIATSRTAVAALVAALREALETNARLNRRSQIAEAAIADLTREPVGGRKHRSVAAEVWERCEESHGLACRTTREGRAEVERLQAERPVNVAQVRQISPFRYPGGKTWLVPVAREWLRLIERPKVLLEPFAGGGVIALTAAADDLADEVVMVELDDDVAAVWEVLINGTDRSATMLANKVLRFEVSLDHVREVLDATPRTVVDKAFRTIVKNRCQRGGIMAPGAGLVKTGEAGRGLASRWYPETLAKRFSVIRTLRERVTFVHGDAFEAIEKHSGATMFVDPPYTAAGKRAGSRLYTHTELDHARLFADVAEHAGPALLTYDDTPEVRALADEHGFTVGNIAMKSTHHAVMHELTIFKDALAREMCVWGNPGGILAARGDHT